MAAVVRDGLAERSQQVRLFSRGPVEDVRDTEDLVRGDLADLDTVTAAFEGADIVLHVGGIADEAPFDDLVQSNIVGCYNTFEAARRTGVRRVVYASSNHVTGFYPVTAKVSADSPMRPDSLYGVTKGYGELLGRLYHDKWGLEVICLRIGSLRPQPTDERQLSIWLSHPDCQRLIARSIDAVDVGFEVVYGASANTRSYWVNDEGSARLGFEPQDDSESYAGIVADHPNRFTVQGGGFADPDYLGGLWTPPR
jgi:uronate dehydrogenase